MDKFLNNYIERMNPAFNGIAATNAHEIASAFLAFRFGLYANAVKECTHALSLIPDRGPNAGTPAYAALKNALAIVRANAQDLDNSQVTADISLRFAEDERPYLAVNPDAGTVEDPGTLELDNALILIYVAALIASPDDEEAMGEHRKFVLRILTGYKKALGIS